MTEVDYVVTTAGSFDILAEVVCEDDDHLLDLLTNQIRDPAGRPVHRDVRLPEAEQAALQLGYPMSTYPSDVWEPSSDRHTATGALYSDAARDHLWMHFTRHSTFEDAGLGHNVPIITRGEGWTIWDDRGNEYIDGLAGLFVTTSATAAPRSPRRWPSRPPSWPSSRCGPTRTRAPSSSPSGSPTTPPAT